MHVFFSTAKNQNLTFITYKQSGMIDHWFLGVLNTYLYLVPILTCKRVWFNWCKSFSKCKCLQGTYWVRLNPQMFWDVIVCSIKLSLWVFLKTLKRKYCQQKKIKIWTCFQVYLVGSVLRIRIFKFFVNPWLQHIQAHVLLGQKKCMESIFWTNNNVYLPICSQIHLNILRLCSMKLKYSLSRLLEDQ